MFFARLMRTYVPDILSRELDLYASSNPSEWAKLRRLFSGRDPEGMKVLTEYVYQELLQIEDQFREYLPEELQSSIDVRGQFDLVMDQIRAMLMQYFENRPELPIVQSTVDELIDPKLVADQFIRNLGFGKKS